MFGMVLQETVTLDEQGKEVKKAEKIKTREGKSVKLSELLDEAANRQFQTFQDRMNGQNTAEAEEEQQSKVQIQSDDELRRAAEILGLSSIKYYDLRQNRTQNYVFSFDQMLDPRGNTGVYLIYAYVRICSILRKVGYTEDEPASKYQFTISHPAERDLALTLLRLPESVDAAARDLMVNRITDLLYDTSLRVSDFYASCRVLGSAELNSRIGLLLATKKVMELCFHLLGMQTIERI